MAFFAYALVDARASVPLHSRLAVRDRFSIKEPSDQAKALPVGREVPPIYDIPLERVNDVLYRDALAMADKLVAATPSMRRVH